MVRWSISPFSVATCWPSRGWWAPVLLLKDLFLLTMPPNHTQPPSFRAWTPFSCQSMNPVLRLWNPPTSASLGPGQVEELTEGKCLVFGHLGKWLLSTHLP
jgi:hypothetical protein